ncbi:MAG: hypothetical protein GC160_00890 [Acidobacteria bacterium]|nr:hypothetical protein [Acidobacteriota bacterium]
MAKLYIRWVLTCLVAAWAAGGAFAAAVSYQTTADWGAGFTGQITIRNDSDLPVSGWALEFQFEGEINKVWDAEILEHGDRRYVIGSAGWNSLIPPGRSVSFGFAGEPGNLQQVPRGFLLSQSLGEPAPPTPKPPTTPTDPDEPDPPPSGPPDQFVVSIIQNSQWDGGFTANLKVSNNSTQPLNGWNVRLRMDPVITALWSASLTRDDEAYQIKNESWNGSIPPGDSVEIGFSGNGSLRGSTVSDCALNGQACSVVVETRVAAPGQPGVPAGVEVIAIGGDIDATQMTIPQGESRFPLELRSGATPTLEAATNNPTVLDVRVEGSELVVTGKRGGRAGIRVKDSGGTAVRFIGMRVREANGDLPGFPDYVSLASVSEDTPSHLDFWGGFGEGRKNTRVDARYIYINGGPFFGWDTWGSGSGTRVINYIRNSRIYGQMPFFVFYNIPEGSESFQVDLEHVQTQSYLRGYFENMMLFLDLINEQSPDDLVGVVLEPDFLGYMAQNAGGPARTLFAATSAAYDAGALTSEDPKFDNTIKGFVEAVNYLINKRCPQCYFGWQLNLWASPPGGFTTKVPANGIIRKTDDVGVAQGRPLIYQEAKAITQYYLDAGIMSHGADFLSIDKYGLDAVGYQGQAARDPAGSIWFWNADHWTNYLTFVRAMHDASKLPILLWQLPVGRINSTREENPYSDTGVFPDLANTHQRFEDSAPVYFLGDVFETEGARLKHFGTNEGRDPKVTVNGSRVEWQSHMKEAAEAGVTMILFGPGVGASTGNVGTPPTDDYWWIVKAQKYYENPQPLIK